MGTHTCNYSTWTRLDHIDSVYYHTHTKGKTTLDIVVQACNPSPWEVRGGGHPWCMSLSK